MCPATLEAPYGRNSLCTGCNREAASLIGALASGQERCFIAELLCPSNTQTHAKACLWPHLTGAAMPAGVRVPGSRGPVSGHQGIQKRWAWYDTCNPAGSVLPRELGVHRGAPQRGRCTVPGQPPGSSRRAGRGSERKNVPHTLARLPACRRPAGGVEHSH